MKVRIPLFPVRETLVVRLPQSVLGVEAPPQTSLSKLIQQKLKFLLNAIYGVLASDAKEQEKRRKLIRLYTKESDELVKVLNLIVAAKHRKPLGALEGKTFHLQKYNSDQEQLADQLVYKWNELRISASSSHNVETAADVLLRQRTNFPSSVAALAKMLLRKKGETTELPRIEQLLRMHVQRSGIWKEREVAVAYQNGTVVVESFGFRSVLVLNGALESPQWQILQIDSMQSAGKAVPPKIIKGENLLREVISVTKYATIVLEIEEIYKTLKDKSDKKLFDISLAGTSKAFEATLFGLYRVEIAIKRSASGPSLYCRFQHLQTSVLFKEAIVEQIGAEIDQQLKKEYGAAVSFSVNRGLLYREMPLVYLREVQKEYQQEQATHKTPQIPGLMVKEQVNIWHLKTVLQVNLYLKDASGVFLGLLWDSGHTRIQLFYGVHEIAAISAGEEIAINGNSPLTMETSHSVKQIISLVLGQAHQLLALVGAYRELRQFKRITGKILLEKEVELVLSGAISVKCAEKQPGSYLTEILGPKIAVKDRMNKEEIQRNLWVAVVVLGIVGHPQIELPELFRQVIISGSISCYPKQKTENELVLQHNVLHLTLSYSQGQIGCTTQYPLVQAWVQSALAARNINRLARTIMYQEVLQYPRLISTIPIQGILGGSLVRTCGTVIRYTCQGEIELRWTPGGNGALVPAFSELEKVRETEGCLVFKRDQLGAFLEKISYLLGQERMAEFGKRFAVVKGEKPLGEYRIVNNQGLVCTKVEGKPIELIINLIELGPDPEKELSAQGYTILPKKES